MQSYRRALSLRRKLQTAEELEWVQAADPAVLHFSRPGGWQSVTNFGDQQVAMPTGTVLIASGSIDADLLPPDTTAWIHTDASAHDLSHS